MDSNQLKNYVIVALATALFVLALVRVRDSVPSGAATGGATSLDSGISDEGNYFLGDEDAPVTLYEFSDYQCPFCERFYSGALSDIKKNYIETGRVKLVFKDFPLDIHPEATPAALAARCAGDQGKYFELHDKLFENQRELSTANYKKWARELGLDGAVFDDCLDTRKHLSAVRKDLVEGQKAGIRGTPGFLVNGELISGAQPFAVFEQAIETALAKS